MTREELKKLVDSVNQVNFVAIRIDVLEAQMVDVKNATSFMAKTSFVDSVMGIGGKIGAVVAITGDNVEPHRRHLLDILNRELSSLKETLNNWRLP